METGAGIHCIHTGVIFAVNGITGIRYEMQ